MASKRDLSELKARIYIYRMACELVEKKERDALEFAESIGLYNEAVSDMHGYVDGEFIKHTHIIDKLWRDAK